MSKTNLKDICTSAPREWLAILKGGSRSFEFTLKDIKVDEDGYQYIGGLSEHKYGVCYLDCCHLCGFTGYTDSKGSKVYGGHIWQDGRARINHFFEGMWVVVWNEEKARIELQSLVNEADVWHSYEMVNILKTGTIIAHYLMPKEWSEILSDSEVPDEVRELLEEGENDG